MGRFFADGGDEGDNERYMAQVTELFGEDLFQLSQGSWVEGQVHLLVDSQRLAQRSWGAPLALPPTTPPVSLAK